MLVQRVTTVGTNAVPVTQWAVYHDLEMYVDPFAQTTAAVSTTQEAMIQFNPCLGNISYLVKSPWQS